MSEDRLCVRCRHFHGMNGRDLCLYYERSDPVRGVQARPRSAWFERSARWFGFGKSRCGPEGAHWAENFRPTPPVGGSAIKNPDRPRR